MVKVTDADREAAERSALAMGGKFTCFDCTDRLAEVIAHARIAGAAALIEAGDRLNELACHQDDCQIVTHGVWSDPIPCTCGYTEAWKKWKEVRGE